MKVYDRVALLFAAMLLAFGFSADAAHGAPKGKISRNIYRIPYANTQTLRMGANDYVWHGGAMDTSIVATNGGVCIGAAQTSCSTDSQCAIVGGTCQDGYCIDSCCTIASCAENDTCTTSGGSCDYVIVAPADGIVCQVIEHYNDGGCNNVFGRFANRLAILHANGEMSTFGHMKQWSVSLFGITPGMFVSQGQPVAIEGDVGRTCGSTAAARTGNCLLKTVVPPMACENVFPFVGCDPDADCPGGTCVGGTCSDGSNVGNACNPGTDCDGGVCTGGACVGGLRAGSSCEATADCNPKCKSTKTFRHIHWKILRYTTDEHMNPFTSGIPDNIYQPSNDYLSPNDTEPPSYPVDEPVDGPSLSGYGEFRVIQAYNSITATTMVVRNQASLVLHAGNRITLQPGFQVQPNAYFRAEIALPDSTAPSKWSTPGTCPCTGITDGGFCYEWSDPTAPGRVVQGCQVCDETSLNAGELCFSDTECNGGLCLPPGPVSKQCHGCSTLSGGQRCCPCLTGNTCQ